MNRTTDFEQQPGSDKRPGENLGSEHTAGIPVVEEQLQVGKRVVETGSVRVSKKVHEEELMIDAPVVYEKLDIERVAINQYVETAPPSVRYEGDTMIIPILEEVVVVEKRLMLVEEVRITKHQVQTEVSQPVTLRKEEVTVVRSDNDTTKPNPA